MPLADIPTFSLEPPPLSMIRGRKALSILDILEQTLSGYAKKPNDRNFDAPSCMSDEQMLAYYKLCLNNYANIVNGNGFDVSVGRHYSFIQRTALRTEIARYTGALLEGMVRGMITLTIIEHN